MVYQVMALVVDFAMQRMMAMMAMMVQALALALVLV